MSRTGVSSALAAFIVLTVVLGGSTAYLLASPSVQSHTTTSTLTSLSTATTTTTFASTATQTTTTLSVSLVGSQGYTVGIAYKHGIGFYLVNGSGMTLYFRTADNQSAGTSTCSGVCVQIWPVFYTSKLVLPPGLNASSFTIVTRTDGKKQIDYNGWPLYTYSGDAAPGDTNGEGIGGIWFAYTLPAPSQVTSSITTSLPTTSTTTMTTSASTTSTTSTTTATPTTTTTTSSTTTSTTSTSSSYTTTYSYY